MDRTARGIVAGFTATIFLFFTGMGEPVQAGVNQWTTSGPDGGWITAVAWHPARSGVVFATSSRVFRSLDSGAHWAAVTTGISVDGHFAFDPQNPDRILVSGSPVRRSTDGGATFVRAANISDSSAVSNLVITPNGSAVYGTSGGRVFRTTDFASSWQEVSTGLPGGLLEHAASLRISPSDPNTLYVAFLSAGLFKTTNGGASWTRVSSLASGVSQFAINPNNASQMLAATSNTMQRSTDGGATWSTAAFGFFMLIEFDPLVVNRVFAYENFDAHVLVSTDAGGAWSLAASVPSVQANALSISSTVAGTLALGTSEGIYVSTNAGQSVSFRSTGLYASSLRSIAVSRSAPLRVYASFYGGPNGVMLRSGVAWQATNVSQLNTVLPPRSVISGLAVDPNDSSIVYAGSYGGIARTADAGNTWTMTSSYFATSLPYSIAIDPANTQVLYAATGTKGISLSTNGGATWVERNSGLPMSGTDVPMQHVFIDPANSQRMFAIDLSGALYRSVTGGASWSRVGGGLPGSETVITVAFDPHDPDRIILGAGEGLYRSMDGRVSWNIMSTPVNTRYVTAIMMDPTVPGVFSLVATGSVVPVLRTVDGGATWEALPWETVPEDYVSARSGSLDPANPGNLLVGVVAGSIREFQLAPDLSVALTGIGAQIRIGAPTTLRMTVQNKATSAFAASDATATLTLPTQLAPGTVTSNRGSCLRAGQVITCRTGVLKVGEAAQVDVVITPAAGSGAVSASVAPREVEALPADNSVTLQVTGLPFAGLSATVAAPATADHNSTVTVQGRMTNAGPDGAVNASIRFNLPAGLELLSGTVTAPCVAGTNSVICQIGSLSSGGNATVDLQLRATGTGGQDVTVVATSNSYDTDPSNNSATASITVKPLADLGIAWSAVPATLQRGQTGTALATITNMGPDAVNIAVANLSGTSLTVTTASVNGGSCSVTAGVANCSLGTIASGASRAIDIVFTADLTGVAQLSGTTNSEATDGATANNAASSSITVTAPPSGGGGGGTGGGSGGSSGGGGALDIWSTLVLLGGVLRMLMRRHPLPPAGSYR